MKSINRRTLGLFISRTRKTEDWDFPLLYTRIYSHKHTNIHKHTQIPLAGSSSPEKKMEIFLLFLLACFTQAAPRTNLQDQVFLFPKRSTGSYVLLKPSQNQAMERFTICLSFYSDLPNPNFGLFSASSQAHDNEILIFKLADGYEVSLRNQPVAFKVPKEKTHQAWEDVCVAWDSATGILQFWLNRVPLPRKVVAKGYRIQGDLVILLGQDQDSYGGSLELNQAFEGELGNVCLWETVLSADEMRGFQRQEDSTPLLDWLDLSYEIKGEVMVVPSLF